MSFEVLAKAESCLATSNQIQNVFPSSLAALKPGRPLGMSPQTTFGYMWQALQALHCK